ncbi:Crp/Fnr family transcriptional regulator [Bacillus sp. A301a_S52]|nr:Crp/Fnr family transcriptional regulator [Bacillus sp. A301a_S52]
MMMASDTFLRSIPVFAPLSEDMKEQLQLIVQYKTITKGDVLFRESEQARALYFIHEGKVKLTKSSKDGKEIVLCLRQAKDLFAEVALFCNKDKTYPATATVIESGAVSLIKNEDLEKHLTHHPELVFPLFQIMAERLRTAQTTLRDVALYSKLSALCATLLRLADDYGLEHHNGVYVDVKLTHEELGNFFGATRESVTRMMNQLKNKGIISQEKGRLIIHNFKTLRSYAQREHPENVN